MTDPSLWLTAKVAAGRRAGCELLQGDAELISAGVRLSLGQHEVLRQRVARLSDCYTISPGSMKQWHSASACIFTLLYSGRPVVFHDAAAGSPAAALLACFLCGLSCSLSSSDCVWRA